MERGLIKKVLSWQFLALFFMFAAALAIRAYDLDDPPFDFHPNRQFFTAIIARGEYYQNLTTAPEWMRDRAVAKWQIEEGDFPTIDMLAAWTYRLIGHEDIFYPRLYSVIFWLLGGLALFWLARDLTSPKAALIALGFYLFAPYGIIASRAFQPDPLMTALTLFAWWAMWQWYNTRKWKWALIAGFLSGIAMLAKVLAAFTLLGGMTGVFFARGLKKSIRNIQFWVMGIVAAIPIIAWIIYNIVVRPNFSGQFSLRFFPQLLLDLVFWIRIEAMWERVIGLVPFVLALLGFFFFTQKEKRIFIAGLWGGYILFMLIFSYFFMTHDYYHISLVPITALSLAPFADAVWEKLSELNPKRFVRVVLVLVLVFGLGANLWNVRQTFHKEDYRLHAAMLTKIGQIISPSTSIVALTEDYGGPLFFYSWLFPTCWPYTGDTALRELAGMNTPEFAKQFKDMTAGKEYFVITDLAELEKQPNLKNHLAANYPVFEKGDGYIIYDLLQH